MQLLLFLHFFFRHLFLGLLRFPEAFPLDVGFPVLVVPACLFCPPTEEDCPWLLIFRGSSRSPRAPSCANIERNVQMNSS